MEKSHFFHVPAFHHFFIRLIWSTYIFVINLLLNHSGTLDRDKDTESDQKKSFF